MQNQKRLRDSIDFRSGMIADTCHQLPTMGKVIRGPGGSFILGVLSFAIRIAATAIATRNPSTTPLKLHNFRRTLSAESECCDDNSAPKSATIAIAMLHPADSPLLLKLLKPQITPEKQYPGLLLWSRRSASIDKFRSSLMICMT